MGGLVTKSLKKHFISAYTNALGLVLPKTLRIADREALEESLNAGPFIDLALSKWTCGLYHKWGHMLGPLEAALLTSNQLERRSLEEFSDSTIDNLQSTNAQAASLASAASGASAASEPGTHEAIVDEID